MLYIINTENLDSNMGLLSNPKMRAKMTVFAERYSSFICVTSYLIGVVWLALLAYEPFNAKVYFSENSLLPGLYKHI